MPILLAVEISKRLRQPLQSHLKLLLSWSVCQIHLHSIGQNMSLIKPNISGMKSELQAWGGQMRANEYLQTLINLPHYCRLFHMAIALKNKGSV